MTEVVDIPHEQLPSIAKARLPTNYAKAKSALAKCTKIDECKDWADKAAALASYAAQAEDDALENLSRRIRARAVRRCGELLKQIGPASSHKGERIGDNRRETALPSVTRTQAARDAGLTEHQSKTALRVANIPEEEFEAAVEAEIPALITELAERGTTRRQQPASPETSARHPVEPSLPMPASVDAAEHAEPGPVQQSGSARPQSEQLEMFATLMPSETAQPALSDDTNEADSPSPRSNGGPTAEPRHPLSIRIPFHPKKAAAVLVKKFSAEQLSQLIAELHKANAKRQTQSTRGQTN